MTTLIRHDRAQAAAQFHAVRARTLQLVEGLTAEDMLLQSMPDASPTKWHLAHTAWFFETFVLGPHRRGYRPFNEAFSVLYNSYYQAVGPQWARQQRGLISRPGLDVILAYRGAVDEAVVALIAAASTSLWETIAPVIELGLNHEEQHQELILTDVKHAFSLNPFSPAALAGTGPQLSGKQAYAQTWIDGPAGLIDIGALDQDFAFDNERPRHSVHLRPYALAGRPVSNAEYLSFIEDGGYATPSLWLAEGWDRIQSEGWSAPLYWRLSDHGWTEFTLYGLAPLDLARAATHLSAFEAAAFAAWAGARLPTEAEWEAAAMAQPEGGGAADQSRDPLSAHPPAMSNPELAHWHDAAWQWTQSAYSPYPGFFPAAGALGEYNGKFMINQLVLRGGSCATPPGHARGTYRNFFPAHARWQFSGLRLAKDL